MRLTVTVPDPVAERARALAARTGRSVSAVVAEAVERHVEAERRRAAVETLDDVLDGTPEGDPAAFDAALEALRSGSDRDG